MLFFHLKRFEFDSNFNKNIKITDKYEYYDTIFLDKYMAKVQDGACYTYKLFAVLVHSGDSSISGHYYVYIRPNMN